MARPVPSLRRIVAEIAAQLNADPDFRIAGYKVVGIAGGTRLVVGIVDDERRLVCSVEADVRRQ